MSWKNGDEDPVVLWGQLLSYMPQVLKVMAQVRPVVMTLPNPRLQLAGNARKPRDLLGEMKARDGVAFPERKRRAVNIMTREPREPRTKRQRRGEGALVIIGHHVVDEPPHRRPVVERIDAAAAHQLTHLELDRIDAGHHHFPLVDS